MLQNKFFTGNNVEFTLSSGDLQIYKILYTFFEDPLTWRSTLLEYIIHLDSIHLKVQEKILKIFHIFQDTSLPFHLWFDEKTQRVKFYVSLYWVPFQMALSKIEQVEKIIYWKNIYKMSPEFSKFDCIWIDITPSTLELKIYEIINTKDFQGLPIFIKKEDVREAWYLVSISGRKKFFFRFLNPQPLELFRQDFQVSAFQSLQELLKTQYTLKFQVKYYCIEGSKKEIYCI